MRAILCAALAAATAAGGAAAQQNTDRSPFRQLGTELPTPNTYRTASGAPGHEYWQQRADYVIHAELDDERQRITGAETITYHNRSPDALGYLWLQLEQNIFRKDSGANTTGTGTLSDHISAARAVSLLAEDGWEGGYRIAAVTDAAGRPLPHTVNGTMMRVDLPRPLRPGESTQLRVRWSYDINDNLVHGARTGYERFPEDGNYLYQIAHWFPRMAVYGDAQGWQHKQFLGTGEFALPFGNYEVHVTVPDDHVVAATGTLQNPQAVLTAAQRERLARALASDRPVLVVTGEEARANEAERGKGKKTWIFRAENVRDFAFASSRKFLWDAMGVDVAGRRVLAQSYYPREANPLWGQYSTEAVAHTLRTYSRYSIPFPYPQATSVHGPIFGMEYPMISFNGARPEPDGTYSEQTKRALVSVVIHEVGHNFFPMIVNSDERQWTWMDEGINSFLEYLAEQEWERDFPSERGPARTITDYMRASKDVLEPVMTNSESIRNLGDNAYGKPAAALNILRETVMGRELFDHAFREYARRWAFKHPTPADFFRTMEDASAVDLDWFWRGWFYTTDHVDLAIENVRAFRPDTQEPTAEKARLRRERGAERPDVGSERNRTAIPRTRVEERPHLRDFYDGYDELEVHPWDEARYRGYLATLTPEERAALASGTHLYEVEFRNVGGLVMPILLELEYEDGTREMRRIPAEVWRYTPDRVTKVFATSKPVRAFALDPNQETADTELANNRFPRVPVESRFQVFKRQGGTVPNPMQLDRAHTP
jgi:hypothetical protein